MKSLFKKITAYMLMFVVLSSMAFGSKMEAYATEVETETNVAAEGETTEGETKAPVERTYRRIFITGDGTVCNWDAVGTDIRVQGAYDPQAGWSEMLTFFIKDSKVLQIQNGANTGFSLRTYYDGSALRFTNSNQLTALLGTAGGGQPGDYLLVQFGQSDAKAPNDSMSEQDKKYAEEAYTDVETYKTYLKQYITTARDMEVIPILITPIADWKVDDSGAFVSSYAEYAQAVRDVAAEEGTLLIDMDKKSREFYATLSDEELKKVFLFCEPGEYDTNHSAGAEDTENFQIYGAMHMARLVAEGLAETEEAWLKDNIVNTALPTAKPSAPEVTVTMNKEKMFKMQWNTDSDAQVYYVYQMVDGEWKLVQQTEGVVFSINTAIDEANCEYKVVAKNNVGLSDDSNVVKREVEATSEDETQATTAATVDDAKDGVSPILIAVIVVVVVIIVAAVVIVILKNRGGDDDEYEEDDEYEDDEYEDDEYEDDEYEDDEYEDDEYEEDEE